MAKRTPPIPRQAGVTLVELMVSMAITAIVAMLATQTYISFIRDDASRRKVADVQGTARLALQGIEGELRHASLGAGTGRIWTTSGGNPASRPAVQIFSGLDAGTLDLGSIAAGIGQPKPGTDALLVVEAIGGARAATVGEITGATPGMPRTFQVTTTQWQGQTFVAGDAVLVGDYQDATWAVIQTVNASTAPPQLTVTADLALPGNQTPRIPSGAVIRRARARIYYVDARDQLIRLDLLVPRAPASEAEISGGEVLAGGIENLQISCQVATPSSTGIDILGACGGPLPAGNAMASESVAMFGAGVNAGMNDASTLRTIVFDVAARSIRPLVDAQGDAKPTLEGVALGPGQGADPAAPYVRRAYQVVAGVRNTSLGAF
jgi:prepilin-type N-terminal cleavage/methylation domain-containing protein